MELQVTLRARLTTAFLAVVLGPVLLGAFFVGTTVTTVSRERATERLDVAAAAVRSAISASCGQLRAVAQSVAQAAPEQRQLIAQRLVAAGVADGVHIAAGDYDHTTKEAPPPPWADCAGPDPSVHPDAVVGFEAMAVRVPLGDAGGSVWAATRIDGDMVRRLSAASGAQLTLLAGAGITLDPATESGPLELAGMREQIGSRLTTAELAPPIHSTLDPQLALVVSGLAETLRDGGTALTDNGHLVHRLGPVAGQPLPLAVSLRAQPPEGTYLLLVAVVLITSLVAISVAWWLARNTTRPLVELAGAADRVAAGDLEARVPVPGNDEIGRLATAFNHMTRELQAHVSALTASRDQLRGHLGVLGDTLSSTHDLDRILRVILQTARHATGAASGALLLADPLTGELVAKCTEGLTGEVDPAAQPVEVRVPLGQGLVGSVASTGVPRLGRVERDGPRLSDGEPGCRTYVVVPFSAPGLVDPATVGGMAARGPALPAARGVLALYDRLGRDEFDDSDLITLRTFAGQAAVAVDNVRVHEEAQRLSVTDPLTGLFNYRSLRETLRRETDRAGRFGRKLCLLALDLDRFKDINDGHGHAAGDAVLTEFARRIRDEIREVDVAFRHGGEEFVILLPETDEPGGVAVAERLCEAVRRTPIVVPSRGNGIDFAVSVTVSIGVAVYPDHGRHGSAVLGAADEALYAAKAAGRDTFTVAGTAVLVPTGGASGGPQAPRQGRGR